MAEQVYSIWVKNVHSLARMRLLCRFVLIKSVFIKFDVKRMSLRIDRVYNEELDTNIPANYN